MDKYRLDIEMDGVTPLNSADANNRWKRKKARDLWFVKVRVAIGRDLPHEPLEHALVTITRCSSVPPDADNMYHGIKFLLDSLVACGIIADDKRDVIGMPVVKWRKAKPRQSKTLISVRECAASDLDQSAWDFGA